MFLKAFGDELVKLSDDLLARRDKLWEERNNLRANKPTYVPTKIDIAKNKLWGQREALRRARSVAKAPSAPKPSGDIKMPPDVVRMGGKHVPTPQMGRAIAKGIAGSKPPSIAKQPPTQPPKGFGGR